MVNGYSIAANMNTKLKKILLGISGGIAVYKSLEIVRKLRDRGIEVQVVMTQSATEFVQPLTFQALSNKRVATELFDPDMEDRIGHIELAQEADAVILAPATANIMAKMAHGIADDLLSTIMLATNAPVFIAPAMNDVMWNNPATQQNLETLKERGIQIIGPGEGFLACGTTSIGRMEDPAFIVDQVLEQLAKQQPSYSLAGKNILITAGPTREPIDPVRYISNHSSGKMGFSIAEAALTAGAKVTLIAGPVSLASHPDIRRIDVTTTEEMYKAAIENAEEADIIIKSAAVADYRVEQVADQKMKKQDQLELKMVKNPDILMELGKRKRKNQILVGFAAESERVVEYAQEKRKRKNLDMIVANNITAEGAGFNIDTNIVTLITENAIQELPQMSKTKVADEILKKLAEL